MTTSELDGHTTGDDLRSSDTVLRWLEKSGYCRLNEAEQSALLDTLAAFCDHMGASPADLVASCLRDTAVGPAISGPGRKRMQTAIDEFVAGRGLTGHAAVVTGNHIRGFLVHNGVFIQGRVSIR